MELAPVIIVIGGNIVTFALAVSFAAGWYGGRNCQARCPPNELVREQKTSTGRIAVADLSVRIRRLEAIAAGIDL